MYAVRFLLMLLFVCLQMLGSAQVWDMHFNSPIQNKSFAKSSVTCIIQDSTGYIWIGTEDGLYSYNGYQLNRYNYNISDSTSLVNNNIKNLFVDDKGNLWIATIFGICVYEKTYDRFKRIAQENNYAGLENLQVLTFAQDKAGAIYVATGSEIYKYDEEANYFNVIYRIEDGYINEFIFDDNSNIWIAALENGGLIYYNRLENKVERFLYDEKNNNSISGNSISDIVLQDNLLWIGTYGTGVNSFDLETRKFKRYPPPDSYAGYTTHMYLDKNNNLWTIDLTGTKLYDKVNDYFWGYYGNTVDENSFKSSVACLFQDRQENYWVGYSPGGIEVRVVPKGFINYDNKDLKLWHTSDNNITAIEFDTYGNWWLGNGFNGIDVFDWEMGQVKTYHYDPDNSFSLGQGGVACIYRDRENTMWVGTNFGGLQYYSKKEDRFYSYKNNPNDTNSIANNDVRSIIEDSNGNIWLVAHGKGVDRFDRKEGVFYHYNQTKNNLANDWAFQILFDSKENLWVATAWGLSRLAKGLDTFENYFYLPTDSNSLSGNLVNCLFEDSNNQIWVGTTNGLCKFRPTTNDYKRIYSNPLGGNINAIQEDSDRNLWLSTNEGLTKFNPETREIISFDELDGLFGGTYQLRSVAKNADNNLFFGGIDGLTVFDSQKLVFNKIKPEVIISGFSLFNERVNTYGENAVLKKHISETDKVKLNFDQNTFGIEFVATNLINSEKNKFKYKLEGVDKDWITIEKKNIANYTQLQPGHYTFRVIASNNDDVWNNTGASLDIVISPPWWLTIWFKLFVLISIFLLVFIIIRQRLVILIRQKKQLESKVLERTNVLHEKNILLEKRQLIIESQSEELKLQAEELQVTAENIEEKNNELTQINATKDKLFSIIAHDLINPFNVILGFTDSLIESYESWDDKQKLEALNYIKDSSENAFNLLENLLQWSRSQKGMIDFSPTNIGVLAAINSVLGEVKSFALKKDVKIVNLFKADVFEMKVDENMLKLICRNLLMNAIKFSNSSGEVFIDVQPDYNETFVCFSVRDNGVGMEKEKAKNLFSFNNNNSTAGTNGEKGVGLGLVLCFDFVKAHKGEIWVESKPNEGSTFFFTIQKFQDNFHQNTYQ